jgi:hypothetical protein
MTDERQAIAERQPSERDRFKWLGHFFRKTHNLGIDYERTAEQLGVEAPDEVYAEERGRLLSELYLLRMYALLGPDFPGQVGCDACRESAGWLVTSDVGGTPRWRRCACWAATVAILSGWAGME